MAYLTDEELNDPCCGCNCEDDNECQDCYDKLITELAQEMKEVL